MDEFNLDKIAKQTILKALQSTRGHQVRTAKLLGISVRTLYSKLKKYCNEDQVDYFKKFKNV